MNSKLSAKKIKWIIIIFVVAIIIAFIYQRAYKNQKTQSTGPEGYPSYYFEDPLVDTYSDSDSEYLKSLKNEPSDIEGMTKYDKYAMGLLPEDGSDTDGDGLTDKDEIEVYNSDPLKKSTSGDLYDDGYKVSHNMDLSKSYEYDGEQTFKWNECDEIELTATTVDDFDAVVKNITGSDDAVGNDIIAEYRVYYYSGLFTIKIASIYKGNTEDLAVLVGVEGEEGLEEYPFTETEQGITLTKSLDGSKVYKIYLVPADMADKLKSIFSKLDPSSALSSLWASEGSGLLFGSPLMSLFGEIKVTILVEDIGEMTDIEKQVLVDAVNWDFAADGDDKITSLDDKRIQVVSKAEIDAKYKLFQTIVPFFEYSSENPMSLVHILFAYCSLDNLDGYKDTIEKAINSEDNKKIVVTTGFDINKDELPFKNFGSQYSPGGNCVGIAHLTTVLFNTKSAPTSGSYPIEHDYYFLKKENDPSSETYIHLNWGDVEWNIGGYDELTTLFDAELVDYRDYAYYDERCTEETITSEAGYGESSYKFNGLFVMDLEDDDSEFVKMIGCYWKEGNDANPDNYQAHRGLSNYSYKTIENMKNYIDNGKIFDLGMSVDSGGGHRVTVYGYEYSEKDPDTTIFYIYDNNYPRWGADVFRLKVTRKKSRNSDDDVFDYYYCPMGKADYCMSNKVLEGTDDPNMAYHFWAFDENFNLLNE